MPAENQIIESFDKVASEIPGFIAAALVDIESGMMVTPTTFIYLATERATCNIAIVRVAVNKHLSLFV